MSRSPSFIIIPEMGDPVAFLLTFRTYGTWLHGDERGSVDRDHNAVGAPMLSPDPSRARESAIRMSAAPTLLDDCARSTVATAFRDKCVFMGWPLLACSVRTNHAHLVIAFAGVPPELIAQRLKSRATRLLRERGCFAPEQPIWSSGPGSRRYLWTEQQVAVAVAYVDEAQDLPH